MWIDGVKHACMKCVRGHRTKYCSHYDAKPVRRRGRPTGHSNAKRIPSQQKIIQEKK